MPSPSLLSQHQATIEKLIEAGKLGHVAIIMDGNRRWAQERYLPKAVGHGEGVRTLKKLVEFAGQIQLGVLTVYAFSTENWNREKTEVDVLMKLFVETIHKELDHLCQNNVRLRFIGDLSAFSKGLQTQIHQAMVKTENNTGLCLQIALNYGGRHDIVQAVQVLAQQVQTGTLQPEEITEEQLSRLLYTQETPDPDLLIRTGGEYRLSNYLLWQSAYAELYITDTLWPDFTPDELTKALVEFSNRQRRYGK